MRSIFPAVLFAVGVVGLSGCALQADRAAAPKFTEAEKAAMTEEEKLAIYNAHVREEDRVTCTTERRTGSHMMLRVCGSTAERRTESAAAREALRRSRNQPMETLTGP